MIWKNKALIAPLNQTKRKIKHPLKLNTHKKKEKGLLIKESEKIRPKNRIKQKRQLVKGGRTIPNMEKISDIRHLDVEANGI